MKKKINFADYELIDELDSDEQKIWNDISDDEYKSVMTDDIKKHYVQVFKDAAKRNQSFNVRLTAEDKLLAQVKAKEEGLPYQVFLSSVLHKFLHGKLKQV